MNKSKFDWNDYTQVVTEKEKNQIKNSKDYSDEKFYRYKFGWRMLFPELTEEEIENLVWNSFIY